MDDDKAEKKKQMIGSIKDFITNMVKSEEQYFRFREMDKEDNVQMISLVQQDIKLSKNRAPA